MTLAKLALRSLAIAAAALSFVSAASAIQIQMAANDGSSIGYYRAKPLGEFVSVLGSYVMGKSTDGIYFGTFCIERNEGFKAGNTYEVTLNDGAVSGGKGGAINGKDVISKGTGWLYEQYVRGNFFGTVYNTKDLQKAIWFLEDEISWSQLGSGTRDLVFLAASSLNLAVDDNWVSLKSNYDGRNVQVMNLTSLDGSRQHQDQLVYVHVPDSGATLALLSFAFAGLLAFRRFHQQN